MKNRNRNAGTDSSVPARRLARANLTRKSDLIPLTGHTAFKWARNIHRLAYLPGMMSNVFLLGHGALKAHFAEAPVLAFSHKKIQDFVVFAESLLARPFPEAFFGHTVVAQGGLFSGIYFYRDLVPGWVKKGWVSRPVIAVCRMAGAWLGAQMRAMNLHPVFRRFRDVPGERLYESTLFAGPQVTGRTYAEFLEDTRRITHESMRSALADLKERGKSLAIFPEGKYQYDGTVARLNRLIEEMVSASPRPIVLHSISYDELCPDRLGRIDAFVNIHVMRKDERGIYEGFREAIRRLLQEGTTATASHLIAGIVLQIAGQGSFLEDDVARGLGSACDRLASARFPYDQRLDNAEFRRQRLHRFFRGKPKRWLLKKKGALTLDRAALRNFHASERTVDDLLWNRNNIAHLSGILGFDL